MTVDLATFCDYQNVKKLHFRPLDRVKWLKLEEPLL